MQQGETQGQVSAQPGIAQSSASVQQRESNGLALASLICGILSFFFGVLTAIPAVICGHMALGQLKRFPERFDVNARSMSIAGLVMGYIFIGLTVLFLAVIVILIIASAGAHGGF